MKRSDFVRLPPSVALAILWDTVPGLAEALADKLIPEIPKPPRYDNALYRKEGLVWASEMDMESLRYWQGRYSEGAARGGQYAEMDGKRAKQLGYWIAWRLVDPYARWAGERNREKVVAEPPSGKPTVHAKQPRANGERQSSEPKFEPRFADEDGNDDGDDSGSPF